MLENGQRGWRLDERPRSSGRSTAQSSETLRQTLGSPSSVDYRRVSFSPRGFNKDSSISEYNRKDISRPKSITRDPVPSKSVARKASSSLGTESGEIVSGRRVSSLSDGAQTRPTNMKPDGPSGLTRLASDIPTTDPAESLHLRVEDLHRRAPGSGSLHSSSKTEKIGADTAHQQHHLNADRSDSRSTATSHDQQHRLSEDQKDSAACPPAFQRGVRL